MKFLSRLIRKRWFWAVVVVGALIAAGTLFLSLPKEYVEAQEAGAAFARQNPEAVGYEGEVYRALIGDPEGPTIFLVHGSPGHWQDFGRFLLDEALHEKFLLVAPDRPGYGGTLPGKAMGSMGEQADYLLQVTEGKPRPWIWVGHSFGASVIARLAMDHPESVDGLLLLAGAMSPEYEPERWFHTLGDKSWMRDLLPEEMDVSNQEAIAFVAEFEAMEDRWDEIRCPTLILHGTKDWMARYGHVDFALEKMTNASVELMSLEEAGHFIPWDRYEVSCEAIERLVEMVGEGSEPRPGPVN